MRDGLYQVCSPPLTFCAGFIIKDWKVVKYAPILRKWFHNKNGTKYLFSIAEWICD